jgi:hypothetical protein
LRLRFTLAKAAGPAGGCTDNVRVPQSGFRENSSEGHGPQGAGQEKGCRKEEGNAPGSHKSVASPRTRLAKHPLPISDSGYSRDGESSD